MPAFPVDVAKVVSRNCCIDETINGRLEDACLAACKTEGAYSEGLATVDSTVPRFGAQEMEIIVI